MGLIPIHDPFANAPFVLNKHGQYTAQKYGFTCRFATQIDLVIPNAVKVYHCDSIIIVPFLWEFRTYKTYLRSLGLNPKSSIGVFNKNHFFRCLCRIHLERIKRKKKQEPEVIQRFPNNHIFLRVKFYFYLEKSSFRRCGGTFHPFSCFVFVFLTTVCLARIKCSEKNNIPACTLSCLQQSIAYLCKQSIILYL